MSGAPDYSRNPFLGATHDAGPWQAAPLLGPDNWLALDRAPRRAAEPIGQAPPAWLTHPDPLTYDLRGDGSETRIGISGYRPGDRLRTPGADVQIGWNGAPRVSLKPEYENGRSAGGVGPVLIPPAPPDANVDNNMRAASQHSPFWLLGMVPNRRPWDYKQQGRKYEAFGNFDYGAVTGASGLPDAVSLRGAGWAQQRAGTSKSDGSFGSPIPGTKSFGDDPVDQFWIEQGSRYNAPP
jgi:hypothetical protein